MASNSELLIVAIGRLRDELPALANLRLVFGVELTSAGLAGPGEAERYRVELPGPKVGEGAGEDERLRLSLPRAMFSVLAEEGRLVDWREAYHYGHLKVEGDQRVIRLVGQAIERS